MWKYARIRNRFVFLGNGVPFMCSCFLPSNKIDNQFDSGLNLIYRYLFAVSHVLQSFTFTYILWVPQPTFFLLFSACVRIFTFVYIHNKSISLFLLLFKFPLFFAVFVFLFDCLLNSGFVFCPGIWPSDLFFFSFGSLLTFFSSVISLLCKY